MEVNRLAGIEAEHSSASITNDRRYRYDLVREWDWSTGAGLALWVMLNPSTADATEDDATIRRVRSFSKREGFGGFVVVNLYALRARNPNRLLEADDPVGPDNVSSVLGWLADERVRLVVAAWGAWGAHRGLVNDRDASPVRLLIEEGARDVPEPRVMSLGKTATGEPCHPLYLTGSTALTPWP